MPRTDAATFPDPGEMLVENDLVLTSDGGCAGHVNTSYMPYSLDYERQREVRVLTDCSVVIDWFWPTVETRTLLPYTGVWQAAQWSLWTENKIYMQTEYSLTSDGCPSNAWGEAVANHDDDGWYVENPTRQAGHYHWDGHCTLSYGNDFARPFEQPMTDREEFPGVVMGYRGLDRCKDVTFEDHDMDGDGPTEGRWGSWPTRSESPHRCATTRVDSPAVFNTVSQVIGPIAAGNLLAVPIGQP